MSRVRRNYQIEVNHPLIHPTHPCNPLHQPRHPTWGFHSHSSFFFLTQPFHPSSHRTHPPPIPPSKSAVQSLSHLLIYLLVHRSPSILQTTYLPLAPIYHPSIHPSHTSAHHISTHFTHYNYVLLYVNHQPHVTFEHLKYG